MNSNDETDLERLMKASMAEKQFTLKPEYWQGAQELIKQDRARKRRRALLFWLPGSLFIGTALTLAWLYMQQPAKSSGDKPLQTSQALAEQTEKSSNTTEPRTAAKITTAPRNPSAKQNEEESNYTRRPEEQAPRPHTAAEQISRPGSAQVMPEMIKRTAKKAHIKEAKPKNTSGTSPLANTAIIGTYAPEAAKPAAENAEVLKTPPVSNEAPIQEKALATAQSPQTTLPGDSAPPLEQPLVEQPLAAQPDSALVSNTEVDSTLAKGKDRQPPSRQKHWMISAGLSLYNPPVQLGSQPFNALLQGSYFLPLPKNYSLFAGLAYLQVNQHFAPRNYRSVSYFFGENITETSIKTYRSDYLFVPLGVDKLFADKHHLLGGIAGAYLLNSYEELTEKRTENGISQTRSYRSSGYKSGLQTYDIQLFAGYALQKASLRFSLGYYLGLTDTGRNAIIRSKRFERNKGVQVSIGYLF